MLFDNETKYWQEEYRKGNLDDEDMPGEIRAVLEGTAVGSDFLWGVAIAISTITAAYCLLRLAFG